MDDDFLDWNEFAKLLYNLCKMEDLLPTHPDISNEYHAYLKSLRPRICIDNYVNLKLFIKEIKTWMEFSIQTYKEIQE